MIALADVHKVYRAGRVAVPALAGVTLTVAPGEFVAVIGPSGCGKSTLLNLVAGLDRPTGGTIRVDGVDLTRAPEEVLTRLRRERVGIVFQFYNLLPHLTARENVALPLLLNGTPLSRIAARVEEELTGVELLARADHFPHELSGGEMQRVAIARALAPRPALLLADEPTGNLDSERGAAVLALLRRLNRARAFTVLMATHSVEAAAVADRVLRLRDGRLEA
ncbi:MAG: ABC transporter ATP-binding protein [candidate division NC10 bacterium]|nr:ABC transporter ATP-binding protein [candidate division NC10 bacterium]